MTVYVFTGPTLSPDDTRAELDAIYLPPVSQGDVCRVTLKRPRAIGIIDGYFEHVPAVWHKEILWAMAEGIHVFGSASMGALRAAELAPFGMEGVGGIFEAYRDGTLEDDDEVAVAHGPAESGYRTLSEAMVNIRRTLTDAQTAGVIDPATRAALERIAKELFYPDRSYPLVLRRAAAQGLPAAEIAAFRAWLPTGRVDQKREDALAMLRLMRERLATHPGPKRVCYSFEYTDKWEQVRRHAGELRLDADAGAQTVLLDRLLDELRLDGDAYARARRGALLRLLALDEARRAGMAVSAAALTATADAFRRERGLLAPEDVARWLEEHHLTREQLNRILEDEARLRWVEEVADLEIASLLPDHLRVSGEYPRLMARARDKQHTLESRGLQAPGLADAELTEDELLRWHFEERLGRPVPPDIAHYARASGFADEVAFRQAVLREVCYLRSRRIGAASSPV